MKKFVIALCIVSCTKTEKYECVCYSTQNPDSYTKYTVQNSYEASKQYCDSLTNMNRKCYITK